MKLAPLRHCRLACSLLVAAGILFLPSASPPSVQARASQAPRANAFDRMFIDMMVPHHQGAVAMAQIALQRGLHSEIKTMAKSIITDQQAEIRTMRQWRKAWFGSAQTPDMMHMPSLPGMAMGMNMMGDINYLRTETQVPFDKAFINDMIPHHQMAISAAELELRFGSQAKLKALAMTIIASQAREVGIMKAYRHVWYGTAPPA